jgi:hypothetical protein
MGDFPGHALAGSFFFIMGLWWSTKSILMHVCKKQKRACFLGSKALFHRSEILEGMVIVGMVLTGEWTIFMFCFLLLCTFLCIETIPYKNQEITKSNFI